MLAAVAASKNKNAAIISLFIILRCIEILLSYAFSQEATRKQKFQEGYSVNSAELKDFTAHIFLCMLLFCGIVMATRFEWDQGKNRQNQSKHGIAFELAQLAFADPRRVIAEDLQHSESEKRYYCFGKAGGGVMTVRFTYRESVIRILGAGYWRRGKAIYERENKIHK